MRAFALQFSLVCVKETGYSERRIQVAIATVERWFFQAAKTLRSPAMEAMSIEQLLLSAWEEKGFVGQTRVPLGKSDVDVLAVNPVGGILFGEAKVREGSQRVY